MKAALTSAQAQGIGGVAGVIEVSDSKSVTKLSASGTVTGTLPTGGTARGIGGIAGSLTTNGAAVKNLTNSAAVTGNRLAALQAIFPARIRPREKIWLTAKMRV